MGDTSWKNHERIVARYFGVEREKRGDDFSRSGCDVKATVKQWAKAAGKTIFSGLCHDDGDMGVLVECKQGYSDMPAKLFKEAQANNPHPKSRTTVMFWGGYGFSWLTDRDGKRVFDDVWSQLIVDDTESSIFIRDYYAEWIGRKVPKYLIDCFEQAQGYIDTIKNREERTDFVHYIPLVALHAKGVRGRLIAWQLGE